MEYLLNAWYRTYLCRNVVSHYEALIKFFFCVGTNTGSIMTRERLHKALS
jgi:hypothetical protein